jgi:hypothetical protein
VLRRVNSAVLVIHSVSDSARVVIGFDPGRAAEETICRSFTELNDRSCNDDDSSPSRWLAGAVRAEGHKPMHSSKSRARDRGAQLESVELGRCQTPIV